MEICENVVFRRTLPDLKKIINRYDILLLGNKKQLEVRSNHEDGG